MINKENLQLFIQEELGYKENKVDYIDLTNNSLHIVFFDGFGEIIHINKFNEWYQKRRDDKINDILKRR